MNAEIKLQVQAYLDGELSPGEGRKIASLLTKEPEAQQLYNELKSAKTLLAGNELPFKLQETPEFYWSQIQRRIQAGEKPVATKSHSPGWWVKIVAQMAGVTAVLALILTVVNLDSRKVEIQKAEAQSAPAIKTGEAALHEIQSTAAEMSAITFHSEAQGVTVVWLSGKE